MVAVLASKGLRPIPPELLRDDLLTYLFCTSPDRARVIAEMLVRNPGLGELLADLEADDVARGAAIEELQEADRSWVTRRAFDTAAR